ncbi:MAG: methyltransferase domain-containing protein [Candidatus Diapherotrites archaeon]|nr:methyltransferase domain-containing protein [Candidatus Diapherotrites archaeon]
MSEFFDKIYPDWKEKQLEKYAKIFPLLEPYLYGLESVLDLGIGKAWFEEFISIKGYKFPRVLGVDISEEAVLPKVSGIEYVLQKNFSTEEKFDFVVCIDALHLLENKNILEYCKPGGIALIALPANRKNLLESFSREEVLIQAQAGQQELDEFVLLRK